MTSSLRRCRATVLALFVLAAATPSHAYLCGDLNGGGLSASDALLALKLSVGQSVVVDCGKQHRTLATGQTTCFDTEGNFLSCAGSGHDGEHQKGAPRAFVDNGDGTVTDRGTGLQWELFDDGGGLHDQENQVSVAGAYLKVAQLNATSFAGHSDWRLPNISELMTLGHLGRTDPGTYVPYFHHDCTPGCEIPDCACIPSPNYEWSSTTYMPQKTQAWALQLRFGDPITQGKTLTTYTARAVRGGYSESDVNNEPAFLHSCADVNASDSITAPDALAILRKSVGQNVELTCILRSLPLVTGQTACYSDVGLEIPCAGTGQDGESERGIPRAFQTNEDGTVTDEVTGLVWEKLSDDGSIHDRGDTYSWEKSFTKIEELNAAEFAGHSDWRAPNFFELYSLINFGSSSSAVYDAYFNADCEADCTIEKCSCVPDPSSLWTSTTSFVDKTRAYRVDLVTGRYTWEPKSTGAFGMRGVRGGD